jgi:trigger factor
VKAIVEKTPFDLPQAMIETQIDAMVKDFANLLRQRGMDAESYFQYTGMTKEDLRKSYAPNAEAQVRARLCFEAVAKAENIEVTEEELGAEIEKIAVSYRMDKEKLMEIIHDEEKESIAGDIKTEKAFKFIMENAIETEE